MKKFFAATIMSLAIASFPAFSHHPAEGIVDDDVYAMIDELVADTPHTEMTVEDDFDDTSMTTTTITTQTLTQTENLIDDGLLDYVAMLDGDTEVTISFPEDGTTTTSIEQTP